MSTPKRGPGAEGAPSGGQRPPTTSENPGAEGAPILLCARAYVVAAEGRLQASSLWAVALAARVPGEADKLKRIEYAAVRAERKALLALLSAFAASGEKLVLEDETAELVALRAEAAAWREADAADCAALNANAAWTLASRKFRESSALDRTALWAELEQTREDLTKAQMRCLVAQNELARVRR